VAAEVDSHAYHLAAEDQDRTTDRHDRLVAKGILLLHFAPRRIKADGPAVISAIGQALEKGRQRPPLAIKGLPPTD
jgi:very-short-patch-repair endonuclease